MVNGKSSKMLILFLKSVSFTKSLKMELFVSTFLASFSATCMSFVLCLRATFMYFVVTTSNVKTMHLRRAAPVLDVLGARNFQEKSCSSFMHIHQHFPVVQLDMDDPYVVDVIAI